MGIKTFQVDSNTKYQFYEAPDCDLINPSIYFKEVTELINHNTTVSKLQAEPYYKALTVRKRFELIGRLKAISTRRWIEEHKEIINTPLDSALMQLLQQRKKKAQQKLLKGLVFKSETLMAIPLHAWHHFKMPYSKYTVEYLPKELTGKTMPTVAHIDESDKLIVLGQTDMSENELRLAIGKRNRIISEFIGDEDSWHCFFRTMSGIKGSETPHEGFPHLHYISSAWGLSRQEVIRQLTSYRYSLKSAETISFKAREFSNT